MATPGLCHVNEDLALFALGPESTPPGRATQKACPVCSSGSRSKYHSGHRTAGKGIA
jgi:hypothetical protein